MLTNKQALAYITELHKNGYTPEKLFRVCTAKSNPHSANWYKAAAMIGQVCNMTPEQIKEMTA